MSGFVELYKAVKWRKRAKAQEKDYIDSESPITPGYYGNLPSSFTLHLGGFFDEEKRLAYYFICEPGPKPLFAVTGWTGARGVTLHQNVNLKSAPLAYVMVPKAGYHYHGFISLAAPPGSQESISSLPLDGGGKIMDPTYTFAATVGSGGELQVEKFVWQQVGKHKKGVPRLLELTRNADKPEIAEKVARWQEDFVGAEGRMANFQLLGSAIGGGLGEHWKLAAITSILSIARMEWAMEKVADQMVERGMVALGNVALMGIALGT